MNPSLDKTSLGKIQRIVLIFCAFLFATLLFFLKVRINSQPPLDQLARRSLDPQIALSNGRPTLIEFYADWCEVCRQMAPTMLSIEKDETQNIDVVLLNVDNTGWEDLIEKYEVNGIPKLIFFDLNSNLMGELIGFQNDLEIKDAISSTIDQKSFSSFISERKSNNIDITLIGENDKPVQGDIGPRSHG